MKNAFEVNAMKKKYIIPLSVCAIMLVLNIAARLSTAFSDFYVMKIFPYISTPVAFLSGLLPCSFGELLIAAGILLVAVGIPLVVIMLIFMKNSRRKIRSAAALTVIYIFTYILTTETFNCFIMYHCTPFSERYFTVSEEHTRSELTELYGILISEANSLADQVERDENGCFVLTDDLDENAKSAMHKAAEKYSQLSGYYPDPKPVAYSYFMSQSGLLGIYFPFTMESNYNADMCDINYPNTICHEYAHLKGIIQEDEAGFIAFIASTGSESAEFRYSGYVNALEYVHNQIYKNGISEAYYLTDTVSPLVMNDWFKFMPEDYFEENEELEIISTETVDAVSDAATDTSLKINGVQDGIESYSRIVNLLLDYYFED